MKQRVKKEDVSTRDFYRGESNYGWIHPCNTELRNSNPSNIKPVNEIIFVKNNKTLGMKGCAKISKTLFSYIIPREVVLPFHLVLYKDFHPQVIYGPRMRHPLFRL